MILQITRRTVQPGMIALEIKGSLHSGPECAKLVQEVDKLIESRETRVIFDMSGVTHADSAAIGVIVKCFTKLSLPTALFALPAHNRWLTIASN